MSRIYSQRGLTALPPDLPMEGLEYAVVEAADRIEFLRFDSAAARAAALGFPRGLAFGAAGELRWLLRKRGYHVVFVTDDDPGLPEAWESAELVAAGVGPERILLWGEWEGDGYYDDRIPKPLQYPAEPAARLAVRLRHYLLDGEPMFRCVGLEPDEGAGEE